MRVSRLFRALADARNLSNGKSLQSAIGTKNYRAYVTSEVTAT